MSMLGKFLNQLKRPLVSEQEESMKHIRAWIPVMANFRDYGFKAILPKPYTLDHLKLVLTNVLAEYNWKIV